MTATNPVLPGFHPDPSILRVGGDYYLATSTFQWWPGVAIYHSRDLVNWRLAARPLDRLSQLDMRGNADSGGIWAPELHFLDGKWYLYYTAADKAHFADSTRYVFVLENANPDPTVGVWVDKGKLNTRYAGLDGSVFALGGRRYFLYSADVGPQSVLAIAPQTNPWTLDTAKETIIARPTPAWEKGGGRQILEGPEFLAGKKGQLFVVYSASACWDDN